MMNMDEPNSGGEDFNMESAIADHMTVEDLGPGASEQDRSDLQALRKDLRYWNRLLYTGATTNFEVNRWSQLPPRNKNKTKQKYFLLPRKNNGADIYDNPRGPTIQENGQTG